mmetsp:Transcript_91855/g.264310  ORF Transcript_91855/g.264310 Transcript_91855/m.264310 type:complete len:130 (+) Transcript_91855:107-496(+)
MMNSLLCVSAPKDGQNFIVNVACTQECLLSQSMNQWYIGFSHLFGRVGTSDVIERYCLYYRKYFAIIEYDVLLDLSRDQAIVLHCVFIGIIVAEQYNHCMLWTWTDERSYFQACLVSIDFELLSRMERR